MVFENNLCVIDLNTSREYKTQIDSFIGSLLFMAPEIFTEDYDHRVDIYSIGCVWYELIVGKSLEEIVGK